MSITTNFAQVTTADLELLADALLIATATYADRADELDAAGDTDTAAKWDSKCEHAENLHQVALGHLNARRDAGRADECMCLQDGLTSCGC